MKKKLPNRYFRAGLLFLRTPLARSFLPKPLSGVKRRPFSLSVFAAESWKVAAERKRLNPKSFLAMEAASEYIFRIDDILDQAEGPDILTERLEYKKDSVARERISQFVSQVKSLPLTKPEREEIFHLVQEFRRSMLSALTEFEKSPKPTTQDIIKMKEGTTGNMGRVGISVLNVCERIPKEKRKELEDAFSNSFMAGQIVDDIVDMELDHKNEVPNIALEVLKEHPIELEKALKRRKISIRWLRKNCPKSYNQLKNLFESYIHRIPKTTVGLQTLATMPRMLWKFPSFTSR